MANRGLVPIPNSPNASCRNAFRSPSWRIWANVVHC